MEYFDVIVAGAGLGGCGAAIAAAQKGAKVLLLEKQQAPGGSSLLSAGGMAFSGVEPQRLAGIDDGPQRLREDLERMGRGFSEAHLVDTYVQEQAATFDWLRELGVRFTSVQTGSGNSVPRVVRTDTTQVFSVLLDALDRHGVVRRLGVAVERLLFADGRVQGVRVAGEGVGREIRAGAVVLATGGFSRNADLVRTFAPDMLRAIPVGGDGSTGDGLRMACALGAGLRDMGFVRATFGSHPSARGAANLMLHPIYKGAIIVNGQAQRFVDESRPYKELGDAVLAQPGVLGWQVFDQTVMDQADPLAGTYDFQGALERGLLEQADHPPTAWERWPSACAWTPPGCARR
ncbi:MAG: FAD-dependent oxidoreductase [Pseudomonadota bacterium]